MDYKNELMSTKWVVNKIERALEVGEGLSLIRIGDGETRAIAHNDLISMEEIPFWLEYAGVKLPDEKIKKELIMSIKKADIVGVPIEQNKYFKPLMLRIIEKYDLELTHICHNRINYHLYTEGHLINLIQGKKIIIVGRKAEESRAYFSQYAEVKATYNLPDISFLDSTFLKIIKYKNFDIALVAAGIPAVILCPKLAFLNKVAIDLGHVVDSMITPVKDLIQLMTKWFKEQKK